jgi:hypothetical protein
MILTSLNSEELHKTKQSIFKVNITNADLHELTKNRVDKDHLIEFAFIFLLEREPVDAINRLQHENHQPLFS